MLSKKILLSITLLFSAMSSAKMASSINEALFLFEMKGEYAEAIAILEQVSVEGNLKEKGAAFFYLGKIFELSGNTPSALFYYKEALSLSSTEALAFRIAERIAALDPSPEKLVHGYQKLNSPVTQIFPEKPISVLLENQQFLQLQNNKWVANPSIIIPQNASVHSVSSAGIWFSIPNKFTLHFQPAQSQKKEKIYSLNSKITAFMQLSPTQAFVNTEQQLFLAGNEGIRYSINHRYKDCSFAGVFNPDNQLVLNCPDNALHFIQIEDGSEISVISQIDPISNVLIHHDGIILTAGNSIWYYKPFRNWSPVWHFSGGHIENICFFENRLAVLESSGNLYLMDLESGNITSQITTDGEAIHSLSKGTLGIFTHEGTLTVLDTLLSPLWKFHFGQRLIAPPLQTSEKIYLPLAGNSIAAITALHYGKKPLLSQILAEEAFQFFKNNQWNEVEPILDSLFRLEPGNATAWFLHAVSLEQKNAPKEKQQQVWAEVARFSIEDKENAKSILDHYSKVIGAKYVKALQMAPRTLYPYFFGDPQNLYTVDVATQSLQNINPENGNVRWVRPLGKLENSPVMLYDNRSFIIASGFNLNFYNFQKENLPPVSVELPGKPFQIHSTDKAVYISTWNGFLIKVLKQKHQFAWSRKIFTIPFHFIIDDDKLCVISLDGEILQLSENSGQMLRKAPPLRTSVSGIQKADSLLVIASNDNQIDILSPQFEKLNVISTKQGIASIQTLKINHQNHLLIGHTNQQISLYKVPSGELLWTYTGQGSIFISPLIHENIAWIDQKNEIIGISLPEGTVKIRFKTPGGSGPPFILNQILFSASPKKLLYAFPIPSFEK